MQTWSLRSLLLAFIIIGIAAWLRFPFINSGMPYFYDEDEAHHHNRVVNMVKRGEFNPNYFLKPSLHFYLRMPVVAVSFLAFAALYPKVSVLHHASALHCAWVTFVALAVYQIAQANWSDLCILLATAIWARSVASHAGRSKYDLMRGFLPESHHCKPTKVSAVRLSLLACDDPHRAVDPLLEKISQHGLSSLTRRERETLELARQVFLASSAPATDPIKQDLSLDLRQRR